MYIKSLAVALVVNLVMSFSVFAASTHDGLENMPSSNPDQNAVTNWFDPATWGAQGKVVSQPGTLMPFNPAHPASWAKIISPQTHVDWHMAFTNPANYAQFMHPQFYMQFLNPNTWMAWMNPASYATFMNPATYMWWMTPTAYVHGMDPNNYMQMMNPTNYTAFMNPMTYMEWMNPNAYSLAMGQDSQTDSVDWNDWFKMFDPNNYAAQMESGQNVPDVQEQDQ